ncbi:MAG TPA: hypothetical protein VNZ26_13865 [Vicinamibacterales bacterium]|nr:hypothetical protein [Vicinamibacterales bacterium]
MTKSIDWPVLLTVRGTMIPKTLEEMRVVHNQTAGSPQGIAAARSLGDLSHMVYAPSLESKQSTAKAGELLFLDFWVHPKGIMDFFSNEQVVQQGAKLFSERDATIWMRAEGSFSYHLPAPRGKVDRYIGLVRGAITSPEKAIDVFRSVDINAQQDARRRGLLSHEVYIKLNAPGDSSPLELLGVDYWNDFAGMTEHYNDHTHMGGLSTAFSGRPTPTTWEQAPGQWSEW